MNVDVATTGSKLGPEFQYINKASTVKPHLLTTKTMKKNLVLSLCTVLLLVGSAGNSFAQDKTAAVAGTCVSAEERKLYDLINAYRQEKGLPALPLSASLTYVAQTHAKDITNNPIVAPCNSHSWSDKGSWTAMCYTSDGKEAAKMWSKPKELTNYTAHGFEISFFTGGTAQAQVALDNWKKSAGHNNVIINEGTWKKYTWNAMGVGIYRKNAYVWFGTMADPEKAAPATCK